MNNLVSNLSKRKKKKVVDMTRQGDNLRREYEQIKFQEESRFAILYGAHQQGNRKLSENSFTGVEQRSEDYLKQLTDIIRKLMLLARDDPVLLKTVIEIIQEEEGYDKEHMERAKAENFEIPGRPKQWRARSWEGFKQTTSNRIALIPKESSDTSENGLSLHLERVRQAVISDLQDIKEVCVPLFSDDWDVYQDSVSCYHECITKHLEDIVSSGLEQGEMVQLLAWINEYTGSALLKNPSLCIRDSELLGAPLSYQTLSNLRKRYLDEVTRNFRAWLPNNLKQDMTDWTSDNEPPRDGENYYYTTYPVLTFKIINENMGQASRISADIRNQLLDTSLKELQTNLQEYTDAVKEYIEKWSSKSRNSGHSGSYLKNKKRSVTKKSLEELKIPSYYIQHSIALLNNFCLIDRNLDQLKGKFSVSDIDHEKQVAHLKDLTQKQSTECLQIFESALTSEMKLHKALILTKPWLDSSSSTLVEDPVMPVESICKLIQDYTSGLRLQYFQAFILDLETFSRQEYMRAMMAKRLVCKVELERKAVASKICQETCKLQETFTKLRSMDKEKSQSEWNVVTQLAEIIDVEKATVKLQITCLVNTYPDVQRQHLSRILRIRGDFTNNLTKRKFISDTLGKPNSNDEKPVKGTIFSAVKVK